MLQRKDNLWKLSPQMRTVKYDVHRAVHRNIISKLKPNNAPMYQIYLFWNDTLHVSDGLSVHHQEFKTVHTATGICQTN